jgi:hypothetical protein
MEGNVKSEKHHWFVSRKDRKDMIGRFMTWQHEYISSYLVSRFVKDHSSSTVDYIILVLFPEVMARVYMAVNDVSFEKASEVSSRETSKTT